MNMPNSWAAGTARVGGAAAARMKPPCLMPAEHALLLMHSGCFKCRCGYVDHRATDCPNDFPDPWSYKELTEEILLAHKKSAGSRPPGRAVAAVGMAAEDDSFGDNGVSAVSAVMPSNVLGSGSETEEEVSAPLTVLHLQWTCKLSRPNADDPLTVRSMLDCGAHMVLIHSRIVNRLGLAHRPLCSPLPVSVALNGSATPDGLLHEYVKISPFSPDSAWKSCSVKAVVTDNLCVSLLLGLPFLKANHLVLDFESQSVINKRCNFNIMCMPDQIRDRTMKLSIVPTGDDKQNVASIIGNLISILRTGAEGMYLDLATRPDVGGLIRAHIAAVNVA